jgi:hypothetical protein
VQGLVLRLDGGSGGLFLSPLCHKIGEDLGLDRGAGGVGDVKAHELEPPLGNVANRLLVVDDVPQATGRHDHHRVGIEVVWSLRLVMSTA